MTTKFLFGFHAVGVRVKTAPTSIVEIYIDANRRDTRMRQFTDKAKSAQLKIIEADSARLGKLAGSSNHQGVVAKVSADVKQESLDELLDRLQTPENQQEPQGAWANPLFLLLDSVTDPHNLGACLRVADGAGVHAVVAPKDHAVGVNATVAKVASGAADTIPYFMVTNLSRTIKELQECGIWVIGTSDTAEHSIYDVDLTGPVALVLGAEGTGMRQLTAKNCDQLVSIPMLGGVESLNVSVASGVCLYEAVRQRQALAKTTNKVV